MPGGDRTGPAGAGPMTGRGMGQCAGRATTGLGNSPGQGYRSGGGGRGWRNRFWTTGLRRWWRGSKGAAFDPPPEPSAAPEQEMNALRSQAQSLSDTLEKLQRRIQELESASE